jgi:NAD(P)-dependent dehydrogenase (short-subunit alcohol dehydrogenase family)
MQKQAVLITGTSTGIGQSVALDLCQKGFQVFAGVRKMEDAKGLVESGSGSITPLLLDVTDQNSMQAAIEQVSKATGGKLYCLINNAGVAPSGPLEMTPISDIRNAMDVNVIGPFAMTKAAIPLLRNNNGGRIINISSISGLIALPALSCYAATKHALEAITDSLRVELSPFNIHVVAIEPGNIQTPIWEKGAANISRQLEATDKTVQALYAPLLNFFQRQQQKPTGIPVENLTRVIAQAVTSTKPKNRYLVGSDAKLLKMIGKLPDTLRDAAILKAFR